MPEVEWGFKVGRGKKVISDQISAIRRRGRKAKLEKRNLKSVNTAKTR
jgi:hypothetical protein